MSAPTKKRMMQPRESDGNTSDDNTSDDNTSGNLLNNVEMMIDVEFEGHSPESSDYHCVKQLLQQLFLKAQVNLSDMASILVNQHTVGSVLKQVIDDEDDDDDVDINQVFGITTILNMTDEKSECVEQLHKLLLDLSEQHGDANTFNFIKNLLNDKKQPVALLLNERYVNIPPPISVPLLLSVSKEMDKMKSTNPAFDFAYLIMICKLYKTKQSKKANKSNQSVQEVWSNAEEEIFNEEAEHTFEFCVKSEKGSGMAGTWDEEASEMIPYRRVLLFPTQKLNSIIAEIQSLLVTE